MTGLDRDNLDHRRMIEEETLISDATELLAELLDDAGIERKELARRLGKSKAYVTQVFSGRRNMTMRTLAALANALDHRVQLTMVHRSEPRVVPTTRSMPGGNVKPQQLRGGVIGSRGSEERRQQRICRGAASPAPPKQRASAHEYRLAA